MAINPAGGHPDMDYGQALDTYKGFLTFAKIGIVSVVLILVGMFYFLV